MTDEQKDGANDPSNEAAERRRTLLVILLLLLACAGGYFLVSRLMEGSKLEDCMMQGRKNCVPIENPERDR